MLIPFIALIWMLMFNMAYNADRHRKTQAAARLAAHSYVTNLAKMNGDAAKQAAQTLVNGRIFPGENSTAELVFSNDTSKPQDMQGFNDSSNLLAGASNRLNLTVLTKRTPPYEDLFPNTRLEGRLTFAANTWTYCEMKDGDFGQGLQVMSQFNKIAGDYGLWLFGGCGGGLLEGCPDECP